MALPAPHLLTIPRELRDKIYGYLSHEVIFYWAWKNGRYGGNGAAVLQFENAPILPVLLTHSRLHDEYIESESFQNLCMNTTIHVNCYLRTNVKKAAAEDQRTREKALSYVRQVTVFVYDGIGSANELWPAALEFAYTLSPMLPKLSAIRIAAHVVDENDPLPRTRGLEKNAVSAAFSNGEVFFAPPPESLLGLPLRQCGQGYRYGYFCKDPLIEDNVQAGDADSTPYRPFELVHEIAMNGAWLFTYDHPYKRWLQIAEIVEHWPLSAYPKEVLDILTDEEIKSTGRMGFEMREWEEIGGDAVRSWGIRNENEDEDMDSNEEE